MLTKFDRKAGGELHLNKLPEFIKVLEGCDHLQNIQQPEEKENHLKLQHRKTWNKNGATVCSREAVGSE